MCVCACVCVRACPRLKPVVRLSDKAAAPLIDELQRDRDVLRLRLDAVDLLSSEEETQNRFHHCLLPATAVNYHGHYS